MRNKKVLRILQAAPVRDCSERWQDFCQRYDAWYKEFVTPNLQKLQNKHKMDFEEVSDLYHAMLAESRDQLFNEYKKIITQRFPDVILEKFMDNDMEGIIYKATGLPKEKKKEFNNFCFRELPEIAIGLPRVSIHPFFN